MRIVVHGQQAFGKAVLEALLKRGENVVGVYVAPEKPGQKADPLKEAALAAKLPVFQPASYRKPEVWEEFKALKPDLQVMAFVTLFVPEEFLNIPTHGTIQYHPSLLPAFPGLRAIEQAVEQGVKVTGVTVHFVDEGMDSGAIVLQEALELPYPARIAEIEERVHGVEHRLLPRAVRLIAAGRVRPDPANPRAVLVDDVD